MNSEYQAPAPERESADTAEEILNKLNARSDPAQTKPKPEPPLTTTQCLGMLLIFFIPVINIVMALRWAYGARGSESRRSFARAELILIGIVLALTILCLTGFVILVRTGILTFVGVV